jgi:hypothetical protein
MHVYESLFRSLTEDYTLQVFKNSCRRIHFDLNLKKIGNLENNITKSFMILYHHKYA